MRKRPFRSAGLRSRLKRYKQDEDEMHATPNAMHETSGIYPAPINGVKRFPSVLGWYAQGKYWPMGTLEGRKDFWGRQAIDPSSLALQGHKYLTKSIKIPIVMRSKGCIVTVHGRRIPDSLFV